MAHPGPPNTPQTTQNGLKSTPDHFPTIREPIYAVWKDFVQFHFSTGNPIVALYGKTHCFGNSEPKSVETITATESPPDLPKSSFVHFRCFFTEQKYSLQYRCTNSGHPMPPKSKNPPPSRSKTPVNHPENHCVGPMGPKMLVHKSSQKLDIWP